MKCIARGVSRIFKKKCECLEYGPHFATVATRWDPLAGGALEGTTKNAYMQIFDEKVYFLRQKAIKK